MHFLKKHNLIFLVILVSLIYLFIMNLQIPMTGSEVFESYNSYYLKNQGELPQSNSAFNFGIYLRYIPIYLLGLNIFSARIVGLILMIISSLLFNQILKMYFSDKKLIFITNAFYLFSPVLFDSSIFTPVNIFSLIFLELLTLYWKTKVIRYLIFIVIILTFAQIKTIIPELLPKNYTYLIDKRLSFGQIYGSKLVTKEINFNRMSLNKIFFGVNQINYKLMEPLNFERLAYPLQSMTILSKEVNLGTKLNPLFYMWEIPLIILGIIFFKNIYTKIKIPVFVSVFILLCFKNSIIFILPLISLIEGSLITYFSNKYKYISVYAFILIVFSFGLYTKNLFDKPDIWSSYNDRIQKEIWLSINEDLLKKDNVVVTDRFGDPAYYFLFYKKVSPEYFKNSIVEGAKLDTSLKRITQIDNVQFRSFVYDQEKENTKNSVLWVGSGRDFREKNDDLKVVSR